MYTSKLTLFFFAAIILTLLTGCAGQPRSTSRSWADDIAVFQQQLPRKHKNLFFSISAQEYQRRLEQLKAELPQLSDIEVEIELRRVLADVGDAHTALGWQLEELYPLDFNWFAEGVFVMAASPEYADLIGQRLTAVDGNPVSTIKEKLAEIIPHENEAQLWNEYPAYLAMPKYLRGLDIIENKRAVFEFENRSGERTEVTLEPVAKNTDIQWRRYLGDVVKIPENPDSIPLYLSKSGTYYWKKYLPEEQLLYLQYNGCVDDPDSPFDRFAEQTIRALDSKAVKTFVIDLRFNGGGNSSIMQPLVRKLEKDYRSGREYKLYVVLGRATFSSAVLNAIDLKQQAGAIFIGEPTAGKPNHYGEVRSLQLPYSGLELSYSTKYFDVYDTAADSLRPDIRVLWSFEDLSAWQDGVLKAIRMGQHED